MRSLPFQKSTLIAKTFPYTTLPSLSLSFFRSLAFFIICPVLQLQLIVLLLSKVTALIDQLIDYLSFFTLLFLFFSPPRIVFVREKSLRTELGSTTTAIILTIILTRRKVLVYDSAARRKLSLL